MLVTQEHFYSVMNADRQLETAVENVQYKHIKLNVKTLGLKISSVQLLNLYLKWKE